MIRIVTAAILCDGDDPAIDRVERSLWRSVAGYTWASMFSLLFAAEAAQGQIEVSWTAKIEAAMNDNSAVAYAPTANYWHNAGTSDVDPWGNLYVASYSGGVIAVNGPLDSLVLPLVAPASNILVSRFTTDGSVSWGFRIGGPDYNAATGILADNDGSVYVSAEFRTTMDVDPGQGTTMVSMADGNQDLIIMKYDSSGNYLHHIPLVSNVNNPAAVQISRMAVDASNNLYVCGYYHLTIDLDGGPGQAILTGNGFSTSGFVAKYDPQGNLLSYMNVKAAQYNSSVMDIVVGSDGSFYITGDYQLQIDMDPGPGQLLLTNGNVGMFIARYDANFNVEWARTLSGGVENRGHVTCSGLDGGVVVAGRFRGPINVPLVGGMTQTFPGASNQYQEYITALNANGDFLWFRALPSTSNSQVIGLCAGADSTFYTDLTYSGDFNVDPGVSDLLLSTSAPFPVLDMGFARYRMDNGALVMAHGFVNDGGWYSDIDLFGSSMYITGLFSGMLHPEIPAGSAVLTATHNYAIAVMKYCFVPEHVAYSPAADTITVCPAADTLIVATGAEDFAWFDAPVGGTLIASGDSLILANISVSRSLYLEGINGACRSARIPIQVIVKPQLELFSNAVEVCSGDTVFLGYTGLADLFTTNVPEAFVSGHVPQFDEAIWMQATDLISGCSVTDTVFVTVLPLPEVSLELVVDSICLFGPWVDLGGGLPAGGAWSGEGVVGEQWQPFESGPGFFPVYYTVMGGNGCLATATDIMQVDFCFSTSVQEAYEGRSGLYLFPVPAMEWVQVSAPDGTSTFSTISVFDPEGRRVCRHDLNGVRSYLLPVGDLATGRYILRVGSADGTIHTKALVVLH